MAPPTSDSNYAPLDPHHSIPHSPPRPASSRRGHQDFRLSEPTWQQSTTTWQTTTNETSSHTILTPPTGALWTTAKAGAARRRLNPASPPTPEYSYRRPTRHSRDNELNPNPLFHTPLASWAPQPALEAPPPTTPSAHHQLHTGQMKLKPSRTHNHLTNPLTSHFHDCRSHQGTSTTSGRTLPPPTRTTASLAAQQLGTSDRLTPALASPPRTIQL